MRALEILRKGLSDSLSFMHAKRVEALWRAVEGVVRGGRLSLVALGRALPGRAQEKHRIKAADRLLGNGALHAELLRVYQALARELLRATSTPVLAVDWTSVGAHHYALNASVCVEGRALPVFSHVVPKRRVHNPAEHRRFLRRLAQVLPEHTRPTLVTDAGFYPNWFDAVQRLRWDYVGRVRNKTHAHIDGTWVPVKSLHRRAGEHPRNLGPLELRKERPFRCRLVLSSRPTPQGRVRKTRSGARGRRTVDHRCRKQAREPWVLATSLDASPTDVIRLYALRMQIEQAFRDAKNPRHGSAMQHMGCHSAQRIEVLLMLAALATVVLTTLGRAAAHLGLERRYQANTIRDRRVLSDFVLAKRVLATHMTIAEDALLAAFHQLLAIIAANAPTPPG